MGKRSFLFLVIFFLLISCSQSDQMQGKAYFDFDSLVNNQIATLKKAPVVVNKLSEINGKQDSVSFSADSSKLANELEAFRKLDIINKPIYRGAYTIKEGEKDTKSNLLIRTYSTNIDAPVEYIKFYYQGKQESPKKIEARMVNRTSLQTIQRQLIIEFDSYEGKNWINNFQIIGTQKMILSDSVNFWVRTTFAPAH
jgi:hypothetical protein